MAELFDTTSCNFNYNSEYSQLNGWSLFGVKFSGTSATQTNLSYVTISVCKKNEAGGFTGNLQIEYRDTDQTVLATGSTVDVATLNTFPTYGDVTLSFDESVTLSEGQSVVVTFPPGTNSTNCLFWSRSNTDNNCSNPTVTGLFKTTSVNTTNQLADMVGHDGPAPSPPGSSTTFYPPPPAYITL